MSRSNTEKRLNYRIMVTEIFAPIWNWSFFKKRQFWTRKEWFCWGI